MDIEKLKKKRKTLRTSVTKLANKMSDSLKAEDIDERLLRQHSRNLAENFDELRKVDKDILDALVEIDADDADRDKETEDANEIQGKVTYIQLSVEDYLKEHRNKEENLPSSSKDSTRSVASLADSDSGRKRAKAKLPKLQLKKFSGKVAEWQEFWDSFQSAIHEDEEMAGVDKFKYLRSFLEEPARSVIAGLPLTDADYESAVELLQKRFAKPSVIKRAHLNEMLNLPSVYSEKNIPKLRALHHSIESHYRGLEAMKVDKDSYSSIVVPVIMDKIPESIRYNMIRFGENHLDWTLDKLIESLEKELEIRESHVPLLGPKAEKNFGGQFGRQKELSHGTASALLTSEETCAYCHQGTHNSEKCDKIDKPEERRKFLMRSGKCYLCLRVGHRFFQCRSRMRCARCKGKHHISICSAGSHGDAPSSINREAQPKGKEPTLNPQATSWVGNSVSSGEKVALQTALARVNGKKGCKVGVLFDSGSQRSFISARAVSSLGLVPVRKEPLGIKTFGKSEPEVRTREVYRFSLDPLFEGRPVSMEAFAVEEISTISNIHVEEMKYNFPHLNSIYFSDICKEQDDLEIQVLCGSDFLWNFQEGESRRGGPGEPVAVRTTLGWVLSGPLKGKKLNSSEISVVNHVHDIFNATSHKEIDGNLNKLWDLDSLGIREKDSVHENVIDNICFTGKRYSVGLPWKVGHGQVPLNFANSQARLKNQLKRLRQTPELLVKYDEVIKDQLANNVIEEVSELELANKVSYLPHQAVCRDSVETTKVRVVYDASCKERKTGSSLNDCLHKGPSLTPLIFDMLLRFRSDKVALVGDIEKAFLNIEIHPQDRDCLRFLWVKDIHSPEPEVVTFRFNRVVFGVSSSPFLLNAVIRHHLQKYQGEDPKFVEKMIEGFFVDDLVTSCQDVKEALTLYEKAKERMMEGGFRLRKFKTNNKELGDKIGIKEREIISGGCSEDESTYAKEALGLSKEMGGKTKVLGVSWDIENDILQFDLGKVNCSSEKNATKRSILSTMATIFDPLGLISPVLVRVRILFQELCLQKLLWDDPLPEDKAGRWELWLKELQESNSILVPRCLLEGVQGEIIETTIHGFGDASKVAYCAMVFIVYETTLGTFSTLLCAKTRVAPLKGLSIPRLELMAGRILVNLVETVKSALSNQVKVDKTRYWLDSKTALYWILNQGEWKDFVQNQVNEILKLSNKEDWGHVPGKENPADIGSRGASVGQLETNKLWWEGPHWLKCGEHKWPPRITPEDSEDIGEERKRATVMVVLAEDQKRVGNVIDLEKFSELEKLLRVTALVKRFLRNMKNKEEGKEIKVDELSGEEMREAEEMWIKDAQLTLQANSSFEKMRESLGIVKKDGLLVCKGRLEYSELEEEAKFPVILPRNHRFTELVVLYCHKIVHHCKVRGTLAELRSRFWISKGRQFVKKLIRNCFKCKKLDSRPFRAPPFAPLPEFRVTEAPPFSKAGVDFAGPLYIKTPNSDAKKVYIALFTCCVSRAVHLELVEDLNASTFVNCLRRFSARRGTPSLIISDNAKTFKATAKLVERLFKEKDTRDFLCSKRITWKLNLERAAWYGGFFERLVGIVKRCLRKVLGNAKLNLDELSTVILEIECTLNSRPLTYQDDEIGQALTPSHLILGRRLSPMSESNTTFDDDAGCHDKLTKRFLYLSRKLTHFWHRWRREYLTNLREFHRQRNPKRQEISEGDVILIHEDNIKRGLWKLGVVETLIPSKDGQVRGAVVRKAGGGKRERLNRPISKLYPLEIVNRENGKKEGKVESVMQKDEMNLGRNKNGEKIGMERVNEACARPSRAAAKDARWKSRLMLDT